MNFSVSVHPEPRRRMKLLSLFYNFKIKEQKYIFFILRQGSGRTEREFSDKFIYYRPIFKQFGAYIMHIIMRLLYNLITIKWNHTTSNGSLFSENIQSLKHSQQ